MAKKEIVKGICDITRCKYDVYTKEKVDEMLKIEEITLLTANEGFTINSQKFFKQGNHIWGNAVITADTPFSNSYSYPVKMAYAIPYVYNSYCILSTYQFSSEIIGYMYINENDVDSLFISDVSNSDKNVAKIHLDYVISEA